MIGSNMVATTLYLPQDLYKKVGQTALMEKKPKAQVIREAVSQQLCGKTGAVDSTKKFVESLTKLQFSSGIKDLAKNHDHYTWD